MSAVEITLAVVLGLVVNEFTDVSPWLARKLARWSATLRYGNTTRAEIRAEELTAVINDRPGKLFKVVTGLRFASAALALRLRRFIGADPQPADDSLLDTARALLEDEPSTLVARYLFPTEKYRGEWKRHWINLAKGLAVITVYAVLGVWAAVIRVEPRFTGWVVAAILVVAVVAAIWRVALWYFTRFVITNKRLMSTEGLIRRRVAMLPLLRVTDLRYTQSPLARVLNYGNFILESASRRNALRRIIDLPNPNELYLRLVEEMYEPQAVEARIADYNVERSHDTQAEPADAPDVAEVRTEVLLRIGALSAQLAALTAAIEKMAPAPAPTSVPRERRAVPEPDPAPRVRRPDPVT
ncbi:PH domain-containing protein [Micromonospora sp. CPCC 206061]|uniref:PH domain-containing protein n=1 Tax=Micromonospora sp. CPCC 206061 TaxID=3122410 RepID=UPI002FF0D6BC